MGNVLCVIDHFGSGGAQRQMVELGCGLKALGHEVQFFIYCPQYEFFRHRIDEAGIRVHTTKKGQGFSPGVVRALASILRAERPEAVVSFLDHPNMYAVLAHRWARSSARLVLSERSHHQNHGSARALWLNLRVLRRADAVVANSDTHTQWLRPRLAPHAALHCIYNGFDLAQFKCPPMAPTHPHDVRLLAVGRVGPEKNALAIVQALARFHASHGWAPVLSWAGRDDESPAGRAYRQRVDAALAAAPEVRQRWHWLGERGDIAALMRTHHALVHASFFEGLPNAVCEALASSRPALVSDRCDHPRLVRHGERGFLFDPTDAASLQHALELLVRLTSPAWLAMGEACRRFAVENLSADRMVRRFEQVLLHTGERRHHCSDEIEKTA
jgi:glycosyltransferase involved in cell wall biosynthesis